MADFEQIIRTRRSVRKFLSRNIEQDKIVKLLKAALLAPSGKRIYPCEFIIVDEPEILDKISKAKQTGAALVANAPLAIVVVADVSKYDIWVEDASIASTFIMLEAENLGLGCCWVQMRLRGTEDGKSATENLKVLLGLKKEHEILSILAIGYKNELKAPKEDRALLYDKLHHNIFMQKSEFNTI